MDSLTLDQIQILLTVVDEGSFSRAARRLNRAQSAITYGIQKLEAQCGLALFDRSAYRPTLTEAGQALLLRARRVADEASSFRATARGLARGLEAELTIVLDSMFPMAPLVAALRAFSERFPTVPPRIHVQVMGRAADLLLDGTCMIGLLPLLFSDAARFTSVPLFAIGLVPVVAPDHPLAAIEGPIETETLRPHVQLVLTGRAALSTDRDYGVISSRTWRLADLGAKHAMLLAGLGWGNMPRHMVADDIARGRLRVIHPVAFDPRVAELMMAITTASDRKLGPAARWMLEHLAATASG